MLYYGIDFNMKMIIFIFIAMLAGCAEWQAVKSAVGTYGSAASDEALATALWTVCNASPVGAIERRFNTPARAKLWNDLCVDDDEFRLDGDEVPE